MSQPKDYAIDWDPYKTDPIYRPHLELIEDPDSTAPYKKDDGDGCEYKKVPEMPTDDWPERVISKVAPKFSQPSHGSSVFKSLLDFFIPPLNDHPESVRRWRISVGLSLLILFLNLTLSYGWYQLFGFSGFAYAATVNKINIKLMERDIFETRTRQCDAKTNESRRFYGEKLTGLLREYQEEVRQTYPLPSCRELGTSEP